jgi:hypothetical protein
MMLRQFMQAAVTLIILPAALYALFFHAQDVDMQRWASGTVGGLMTYWLSGRGR